MRHIKVKKSKKYIIQVKKSKVIKNNCNLRQAKKMYYDNLKSKNVSELKKEVAQINLLVKSHSVKKNKKKATIKSEKVNNKQLNKIIPCKKYLSQPPKVPMKSRGDLLEINIQNLYNEISNKLGPNLSISLPNLDKYLNLCLSKIGKAKGDLQYLSNGIFQKLQYFNVSGFDLTKRDNTPINSKTLDKKLWHSALMDSLNIVSNFGISKKPLPKKKILFMSEEYDDMAMPSDNNSNQNEFKVKYNDKIISDNKNYIEGEELLFHNWHDININNDKVRCVNIHTSSGIKQESATDKIVSFTKKFPKDKNEFVIIGGDSNIYYNHARTQAEKGWCSDGISNINMLMKKFDQIGYITLISRHIVFKKRPHNFFNNSQSAYKDGNEPVETMFIAIPKSLYLKHQNSFNYDSENFYLSVDENNNFRPIEINNLCSKFLNAFQGSEFITRTGKLNCSYHDIFNNETGGALMSDHVPIYLDLGNHRIVYANNASLIGSRGINNTMNDSKTWGKTLSLNTSQQKNSNNVNKNFDRLQKISDSLVSVFIKHFKKIFVDITVDISSITTSNKKKLLKQLSKYKFCLPGK